MPKILVVEDEADLSCVIREWLEEDYHVVEIAASGTDSAQRVYYARTIDAQLQSGVKCRFIN